jgi:hypothetical protein
VLFPAGTIVAVCAEQGAGPRRGVRHHHSPDSRSSTTSASGDLMSHGTGLLGEPLVVLLPGQLASGQVSLGQVQFGRDRR